MPTKRSKSKKPDYEQIGKMLVNIYETGYLDRNQSYKQSFIKGVISGFGGVLGGTLLVGLVLWILTIVAHVSFLRPIVDNVKHTVQTHQK